MLCHSTPSNIGVISSNDPSSMGTRHNIRHASIRAAIVGPNLRFRERSFDRSLHCWSFALDGTPFWDSSSNPFSSPRLRACETCHRCAQLHDPQGELGD